jgi:DNA primase large subunit
VAERTLLITEELLAKYPFISASRRVLASRGVRLEELALERHRRDVDRALERIFRAIEKGEEADIGLESDFEVEILSFPIALILVAATRDNWLARRWALAEAIRSGSFLEREAPDTVVGLMRTELGLRIEPSPPEEVSQAGLYRVAVHNYLELASRIDSLEWKLVNRLVRRGWVYLTPRELARLAVEAIQRRILQRVREAEGLPLPDPLEGLLQRIRAKLAERRRYDESVHQVSERFWPPCMARIRDELLAGQSVGHFANFALAAFMINAGYTVDQVVAMYSQRSDFNEKIARYQTEHIAGQRGSRVKYTPPSCSTMRVHGLCVEEGRLCPGIKNPIQYYRRAARRASRERGKTVGRDESQQG